MVTPLKVPLLVIFQNKGHFFQLTAAFRIISILTDVAAGALPSAPGVAAA
jgi:hypothetical protein